MTLDDWYAQNQGKSLLVPGEPESERGQCVQAVDMCLNQVYGLPYHYGNAIDWWNNPGDLLNHFDKITDGSVKKGDFVVFNTQVGSVYGHIDVAMQDGNTGAFQGADSNWGGNLTVHLVQHNNVNYVLGSLRLKGSAMDKVDVNMSRVLQHGILGRNGLDGRPNALAGQTDTPWVGADLTAKFIMDIYNSPEAVQWRDNKPLNDTTSIPGINDQLAAAAKGYIPVGQLYTKG